MREAGAVNGGLTLAIESSCDETGIALIEDGRLIRSNVVASQVALHAPSGGIVPEVAARAHLRSEFNVKHLHDYLVFT